MSVKKKISLGVLLVVVALTGKYIYDRHINHNFMTITEGKVYKSGAIPPDEIADYVKKYHIKSIVDLRFPGTGDDVNNPEVPSELKAEKLAVSKIPGVNYFNDGSDQVPNQKNLDLFFKIMDNKKNYPVLIHCFHGIGRAQMYSAIYRIEYEGWTNEEARSKAAYPFPLLYSSFDDGKPKGDYLKQYKSRKQCMSKNK
ncbi:dual specificity protein phosphatase family protein [Flavobacterium aciduliphilum]|uniref:Tyrosine phosphatase family protein n=1 Tax=Flavobacterium aciduliphilum TaxID=1101402 RepID=A0A328YF13_9FLAO|nr:dual specificity protein phosphatase family protein [Flavobacterium aciduliphilum]RAR72588.1 tyrosine phosphatase family protein [Flavobacterium aciduliphilum]